MVDRVTTQEAAEHMRGQVRATEEWLLKFSDGKYKRGDMDVAQQREKLRINRWILNKLEQSLQKKNA